MRDIMPDSCGDATTTRGALPSPWRASIDVAKKRRGGGLVMMKLTATTLALLVDGVAYSMILFLMSVALTVTLGVMRIANLAHCGFAMIGGYIGWVLVTAAGMNVIIA